MAEQIRRSVAELSEARKRAQTAAFAADDAGDQDDAASTAYDLLQWIFGDSDVDPTTEMGMEEDE
jgi:hypothetical protein